jgi:hypothetical protein
VRADGGSARGAQRGTQIVEHRDIGLGPDQAGREGRSR